MWSLFYRNTRLLILTICLILAWGLSSFQILPRMEDPLQSQWFGLVTTQLPGASAQRVESLVTDKIEQELFQIKEIKELYSTSNLGNSTIIVVLQDSVKNHDEVWAKVRDRLDGVAPQLPPSTLKPQYQESTGANTLIVALTWNLDKPPNYAILHRWAKELDSSLRTLTGTEKVELFGVPSEEIVVEISENDLAALGFTPQELSQQISLSDAKVSSSQLYSPNNNLLVETQTKLDSLERIRQIPIRVANSGELSRLGDIADIKKSIQQPLTESAIIDGKPGIAAAVLMESTTRIDLWREENRQTLEKFQSKLPAGIELQVIFDQSRYVNHRLNHLFQNLILGAVCVIGVSIFLMGWKSALVVGLSLPLSILMVFGAMRVLSIPLHQISVTGLVIALGLLIDNAIVVVDEIQILLKAGYQPKEAISKSVSYLAVPLLASNLTTALTFTPVAMLPGGAGEFLRTIALCVMLALLCSLLLSLTIVPACIGLMFNIHSKGNTITFSRRWWNTGFSRPALTRVYQCCLDFILLQPLLGILLALILPITGFLMAGNIPEQFFPPAERDQFHIELELTASASLKETESVALKARKIILSHPEIVNVHWFFGRNVPSFYYNIEQSRKNVPNYAQALVQLDSSENSRQQIRILQEELDRALPEARVLVRQLEQGPGVAAPIELSIYGSDLDTLEKLGQEARARLAQIPDVTHTNISLGEALPKFGLNLDVELTRLAGLNNTEIAQQLNANLEGVLGGSILEGSEELPVRVRLSNKTRGNLDQIASLKLLPTTINNNETPALPLSSIAEIQLVPELAKITRHNGERVNVVQGFITAGILPSKVLTDFKQHLQKSDFQLPIGYRMKFSGESAKRNEAIGQLLSNLGVLLVLMFAVLVLSFASFKSAIIIAMVGICSIGLGLYSLWMFGYPLGFMAVLGTIGLTGVAINDSIVVLAALKADSQASKGDRKAISNVVVRSTRHILTTTITTIAGFIPLFLDGGEFWSPLAICVAGGVGGATLLALFFVPCAYLLLLSRFKINYLFLPLSSALSASLRFFNR